MKENQEQYHTFSLLSQQELREYSASAEAVDREGVKAYLAFAACEVIRLSEENSRLQEIGNQLKEASERDPLTGCFRRDAFISRLEGMIDDLEVVDVNRKTDIQSVVVFFIDVWQFKAINDTYGYDEGDESLKVITASLQLALRRDDDMVGRYAGDEFVVAIPVHGDSDPEEVAGLIKERITADIAFHNANKQPGKPEKKLSIGHAVVYGEDESIGAMPVVLAASEAMKKEKALQYEQAGVERRQ